MREVGGDEPFDLMLEAMKKEQALLDLDRPARGGDKKRAAPPEGRAARSREARMPRRV